MRSARTWAAERVCSSRRSACDARNASVYKRSTHLSLDAQSRHSTDFENDPDLLASPERLAPTSDPRGFLLV